VAKITFAIPVGGAVLLLGLLGVVVFGPWGGVALGQGKLSGTNSLTLSLEDLDLATLSLSDTFTLSYRVDGFSVMSQTFYDVSGLASQQFRLSTRLGDFNLYGSTSFSSQAFTRASFSLSGTFERVSLTFSLLIANIGSVQTPSYSSGTTFRIFGDIPDLGRLAAVLGIGATPFGQVKAGHCFEGARISWGNLPFCGGRASVDLSFTAQTGLDAEYLSWAIPIPFCDFSLRVDLAYADLLDFRDLVASVWGRMGEWSVNANWSFDPNPVQTESFFKFTSGSGQMSGPFLEGTLSTSVTFDETGLLSLAATWVHTKDHFTVLISPEIDILFFTGESLAFDIPSLRADLRWDLVCCGGGVSVGQFSASLRVSKTAFDSISVTYSYSF
jgi:hypothetical protein